MCAVHVFTFRVRLYVYRFQGTFWRQKQEESNEGRQERRKEEGTKIVSLRCLRR